jgi:hypothetical protein
VPSLCLVTRARLAGRVISGRAGGQPERECRMPRDRLRVAADEEMNRPVDDSQAVSVQERVSVVEVVMLDRRRQTVRSKLLTQLGKARSEPSKLRHLRCCQGQLDIEEVVVWLGHSGPESGRAPSRARSHPAAARRRPVGASATDPADCPTSLTTYPHPRARANRAPRLRLRPEARGQANPRRGAGRVLPRTCGSARSP